MLKAFLEEAFLGEAFLGEAFLGEAFSKEAFLQGGLFGVIPMVYTPPPLDVFDTFPK